MGAGIPTEAGGEGSNTNNPQPSQDSSPHAGTTIYSAKGPALPPGNINPNMTPKTEEEEEEEEEIETKEKDQGGQKQLGEDLPAWGTGYGYLPHGETKES